jgi:hypothetical protein
LLEAPGSVLRRRTPHAIDGVAAHLKQSGFVVMKRPAAPARRVAGE